MEIRSTSDIYYSATASSLSKRPLGEIADETDKKRPGKNKKKTVLKKNFTNVTARIDTGVKKT